MEATARGDYWQGRFEPAEEVTMYGASAMRRRCCICGALPLIGSESAHARSHKAMTLDAFDALVAEANRVVTALKARWNRETSDAIGRAGSHGAWMRKQLPGDVLHDIEYQDGASPMAQIALRRPA